MLGQFFLIIDIGYSFLNAPTRDSKEAHQSLLRALQDGRSLAGCGMKKDRDILLVFCSLDDFQEPETLLSGCIVCFSIGGVL